MVIRQAQVGGAVRPTMKGTLLGTPNREPQEYSRNIMGIYLPGSVYSIICSYHILGVPCLGFPV